METALRIGELARITGLPVKTIRFYSDRGLVPPVERSGGGYRIYDERRSCSWSWCGRCASWA